MRPEVEEDCRERLTLVRVKRAYPTRTLNDLGNSYPPQIKRVRARVRVFVIHWRR